jgi:hypothetical protein
MRRTTTRCSSAWQGSVWSLCRSWYRASDGRNVALWPGFTAEYQAALARPDLALFEVG